MKRTPGRSSSGVRRIRQPAAVAVILLFVILATTAGAEESDRFQLSAGAFAIFRYASTTSLTASRSGLGVSFSPEDTFGWDAEQTVLRLDGRYRFSARHRLNFSWYRIGSRGNRGLIQDISWLDRNGDSIVIPIGARVTSSLDYDILKVAYLWSFYHNDKVELSAGAGLHVTTISIDLTAESTSSGVDASRADTTVPLPVVSLDLSYNVTPKFNWYLLAQLFSIRLGDWDGTYTDTQIGMQYRAFEHLGFGIGIGSNSLSVTEETGRTRFDFQNRITGLHLFVTGRW